MKETETRTRARGFSWTRGAQIPVSKKWQKLGQLQKRKLCLVTCLLLHVFLLPSPLFPHPFSATLLPAGYFIDHQYDAVSHIGNLIKFLKAHHNHIISSFSFACLYIDIFHLSVLLLSLLLLGKSWNYKFVGIFLSWVWFVYGIWLSLQLQNSILDFPFLVFLIPLMLWMCETCAILFYPWGWLGVVVKCTLPNKKEKNKKTRSERN